MILATALFAVWTVGWTIWSVRDMRRMRREMDEAIERADQVIAEYRKWFAQMLADDEEKRKEYPWLE